MYLVRFTRKDGQPDEEYCYNTFQDAKKHLDLFRDDDSDLYRKIELLKASGILETLLDIIRF